MNAIQTGVIVAATDLSAAADEAILQAHERAAADDERLLVCHVIPNPLRVDPLFPQQQVEDVLNLPEILGRTTESVIERVQAVTGRGPEEFQVEVTDGVPHATIVRTAERVRASLVVIGNQGHGGLDRMLLGGVASQVVRHAPAPVLVARHRDSRGHVLVATDLSDPSLPALAAGVHEAARRGARVTFLHCVEGPQLGMDPGGPVLGSSATTPPVELLDAMRKAAETQLVRAVEKVGGSGECAIELGPPATTIVRTAEDLGSELIVVGTTGRTGLRRMLLGSVAEAVVRRAQCSVLVVRKVD
jgi:nucleotide-binding universal stress UspA family protein